MDNTVFSCHILRQNIYSFFEKVDLCGFGGGGAYAPPDYGPGGGCGRGCPPPTPGTFSIFNLKWSDLVHVLPEKSIVSRRKWGGGRAPARPLDPLLDLFRPENQKLEGKEINDCERAERAIRNFGSFASETCNSSQ